MKITPLPFMLLIILMAACSKSKDPNPNPIAKKKVAGIVGIFTPSQVGKSAEKILWSRQEFDIDHQLTLSSNRVGNDDLDTHNSQLDTTTFKYSNGKLVEKKDKNFRYTYTYNGEDTVKVTTYHSSPFIHIETREYGSDRKLVKSFTVDAPSNPVEQRLYGYDSKNNNTTIDVTYYDLGRSPFEYQLIFTYDDRQNILTQAFINQKAGTQGVQWRYGYRYDNSNRLVEYVRNTLFPVEYRKWKNTYNAEGELIQQEILQSNNFNGPFELVGTVDYSYTYY
jgi:hypothetical protein